MTAGDLFTIVPARRRPYVGADVLYVSYGTPGGEYPPEIRAAKVTGVGAWVTVAASGGDPASFPDHAQPSPAAPAAALPAHGDRRTLVQQFDDQAVTLLVMNPTGLFMDASRPTPYAAGNGEGVYPGGTWHWPGE